MLIEVVFLHGATVDAHYMLASNWIRKYPKKQELNDWAQQELDKLRAKKEKELNHGNS